MSRNQRIGLIVAAVLVAVIAFVIASPGGDDEGDNAARTTAATATTATTATETSSDSGTATETATEPPPPKPEVTRIRIRGGEVVGGPAEIKAKNGDTIVIVVSADAPDDIHLHGYDIEKKAAPGQPARFRFKANLEGEFEIESHVAEDAGRNPLVATLIVEPR
jgi:plastocyanin